MTTFDRASPVSDGRSASSFDIATVRADFPALSLSAHGRPLAYLDNAATTQKPLAVLRAQESWYREACSNVHRGVHYLSERSTAAFEAARATVQQFINAAASEEIVFVRGATEAINLVAATWGRQRVGPGDEVLVSEMEHHSNIVPWQLLCEEKGATLRVIPIDDRGEIGIEQYEKLFSERTRIVAITWVSNALGTINPVRRLVDIAHHHGVPVVVDGAQAAPHLRLDVAAIGCDFLAVSGHKMFGPTGIGFLYGKTDLLAAMPPYQGGGEMIRSVTFAGSTYAPPPARFEAGTPNIAGAVALGAAIDYLQALGWEAIEAHEGELLSYATKALEEIPGVRIVGTASHKAGVLSFIVEGVHPHDVGTILDRHGVAIRAGHHCAQPVMEHFGVPATARASFAFYNTLEEVDRLVSGIHAVREVFS